mgnify:CR=1 FL=1
MIKVITWNIKVGLKYNNLVYTIDKFSPDIAFFQECKEPHYYLKDRPNLNGNFISSMTSKHWGNVIYSKNLPIKEALIGQHHDFGGRLLIGEINDINNKYTLVNLHVPITYGRSRYNLRNMFDILKSYIKGRDVIIVGDFNFGPNFDTPPSTDHSDFLSNILNEHGLVDTFPIFNDSEIRSQRPPRPEIRVNRIDFILVSNSLKDKVKSCQIIENEDIINRSDHNPVVAEFNIRK